LPLPELTKEYIENTIPSSSSLEIIIDSLPNKEKNIIWRRLVNLNSIIKALEWLKNNNKLYKDVKINYFSNIEENLNETNLKELESKSLVENEKFQIEPLTSYSIYEQDKISYKSDIEKYQLLNLNEEAFKDNFPDLDHYCFPHIFCTGKGIKSFLIN
jgi:hypothetical protein